MIVRRATASDGDRLASSRLSEEAFGDPRETDPAKAPEVVNDSQVMYFLEEDGVVVGKCRDRFYESWFGGRAVPTAGVASVSVEPESRGRGGMRDLMLTLMRGAVDRGAPVSTLVPTAPAVYRSLGYETITTFDFLRLPTAQLARVQPGAGRTRRATAADFDAIRAVYDAWASAQNGPLTRRGVSFTATPEEVLAELTFTLALDDDGEVVGFTSWKHTGGYYSGAVLEVADIIATTVDGYRLLLASLGSSYAVAPTTVLLSSGSSGLDLVRLVMADRPWPTDETDHYMLAVLDVPGAMAARGFPRHLEDTVRFSVSGAALEGVDGCWELSVKDGRGKCRRVGDVDPTGAVLTAGGLALLYAGAQSCANIAMVGGLTGAADVDEVLDAMFGGRQVHIRDSF